ncbi:MAG: transglutaminase domain-containing protein [Candidatus Cloacimonetes bacterium]|nr:transglutaminase domain-containing protein [Candidatus Cloacimonadota bacterium]
MKKTILVSLTLVTALILVCNSLSAIELLKGKTLYMQAQNLEKKADYFNALELYKQARQELLNEDDIALADQCRQACTRMIKITLTYTHTEEEMRKMIKEKYPDTSDERIDQVIADGRLAHLEIGGETYYFDHFLNTLYHIYPDFMTEEAKGALGKMGKIFDIMSQYLYEKDDIPSWQSLSSPLTFEFDAYLSIPRDSFPDEGVLRVWMPLPLSNSSQTDIVIESICSEEYIPYPAQLDGDIGYVYYEFPLEEIQDSIRIGAKFSYTSYEVRFNVHPEKVGEYDKTSLLYKQYTASDKNIAITPEIIRTARKIAGDEKNPYLIAKKFYDHIVYDLDYSYMPHVALEALKIPESVFVHEHGYGDCGAQSMYFSALCRAVGIPARASGGMQLFPLSAAHCGDHFWAHIFMPNYGWIPVDTSVGQAAKYIITITKEQQTDFIEYFFGNIDPFRYLIQVDVDVPLEPAPEEPLLFGMVLQAPTAECMEMDENPGLLFMEYWKISCKEVSQP